MNQRFLTTFELTWLRLNILLMLHSFARVKKTSTKTTWHSCSDGYHSCEKWCLCLAGRTAKWRHLKSWAGNHRLRIEPNGAAGKPHTVHNAACIDCLGFSGFSGLILLTLQKPRRNPQWWEVDAGGNCKTSLQK